MENMLGSRRRRSKKEISVLHWRFKNNCLSPSSSRTFRKQSYWSFIAGQCCYSVGCAFNLHSIINNGLILGGQNSSKKQTVFFLPIDPREKGHQDPEKIDLKVPRHAEYLHNAWKKHQDAVYWVDVNLAIRKGLIFYQTRSNAIILQGILSAFCFPKVVRLKTGEVLNEKAYMSPRPPPKISLRHDWTKELSSKVDRQLEGEVARQAQIF